MTVRITRKEQQARTRATLLGAAAKVLAAEGMHRASIDDIAAAAGFTKGAFYANFKNKDELFLAMLDDHFADRLEAIERVTSGDGDIAQQAERVGQDFLDALRGDEAWCRLFLEFTSHALRDDAFRDEFVGRTDALRGRIADILDRRITELGIVPAIPAAEIARMAFAMAHGVALEQLLDQATPEDLFATMLRLFFAGVAMGPTPPAA